MFVGGLCLARQLLYRELVKTRLGLRFGGFCVMVTLEEESLQVATTVDRVSAHF